MDVAFTYKQIRNCRRYLKRCYSLTQPSNELLLHQLSDFGLIEYQRFSEYLPQAKDTFKVKMLDLIEISGVLDGKELFITVSKEDLSLFQRIEQAIHDWFLNALD